jgi:hypothetical protein
VIPEVGEVLAELEQRLALDAQEAARQHMRLDERRAIA